MHKVSSFNMTTAGVGAASMTDGKYRAPPNPRADRRRLNPTPCSGRPPWLLGMTISATNTNMPRMVARSAIHKQVTRSVSVLSWSARRFVAIHCHRKYHSAVAQRFDAFLALRGPQAQLDPDLLTLAKDPRISDPPLLHYGLVFDCAVIDRLVRHRNLPLANETPIVDDEERRFYVRKAFMAWLEKECRFPLNMAVPLTNKTGRCIIALDDTRMLRFTKRAAWPRMTRPVLKQLKHYLGLGPNTKAKWWWNDWYDDSCV